MENVCYCLVLILSVLLIFKHFFHHNQKLPPSPLALPIIGHLHLIKKLLHQSLECLSSQYGPILFLQFGSGSVVVVSSPSAIEECFTKNDITFANRPRSMSGDHFTYNYTAFVWAPYGHLWRSLRRLTVIELFSSNCLQKSSFVREGEIRNILSPVQSLKQRNSKSGVEVLVLSFDIQYHDEAGCWKAMC
uniref:Uncharacterized protein n=1 Tax=Davidia involucrata TaxID=16924 RepID=A0A5B7B7Y7_DAVIN